MIDYRSLSLCFTPLSSADCRLHHNKQPDFKETLFTSISFNLIKPSLKPSNMAEKHNIRLSKSLSKLLRHDMLRQGLKPTPEGFVPVEEVLQLPA